jgi:hypothetical protein
LAGHAILKVMAESMKLFQWMLALNFPVTPRVNLQQQGITVTEEDNRPFGLNPERMAKNREGPYR